MALVLSLREGDQVRIGDVIASVTAVRAHDDFDMTVVGDRPRAITDRRATEIVDDVFVSAGPRISAGFVRVAFEAPRDIRIVREDREGSLVG